MLKPKPYPRGRQPWRVREIIPAGARSKEKPHYFATEAAAWDFYKRRQRELGGQTILANALDAYDSHKARTKARGKNTPAKASTRQKARQRIERFFRGYLDTDLSDLHIAHVQKLYDLSDDDGISTVHRNNALAEAKAFLRWAGKQGIVKQRVVSRLDDVEAMGAKEAGSKVVLRVDEINTLIYTAAASYDATKDLGALATLLCIRLNTRNEDVLAIRVRDVNKNGRAIYVESAKTINGEGYRRLGCDGTRSRLLDAIAGKASTDFVFPSNRTDDHMRGRFLTRAIRRLCRDAKVPVVNAKQLRASASECNVRELAGLDVIAETARRMGHSEAARGKVARQHYLSQNLAADVDAKRINDAIGPLN